MKPGFVILFTLLSGLIAAQSPKTEVMTLGTFHFNFPNLDVTQVSKTDQIDVLLPAYQKEIEDIVNKISRFKPTIIVIERNPPNNTLLIQLLVNTYRIITRSKEEKRNRLVSGWPGGLG